MRAVPNSILVVCISLVRVCVLLPAPGVTSAVYSTALFGNPQTYNNTMVLATTATLPLPATTTAIGTTRDMSFDYGNYDPTVQAVGYNGGKLVWHTHSRNPLFFLLSSSSFL